LKDHPLFSNRESSRNEELVSIYLDTKDRALRRQGLSLRLRRKGEELLQTTKGAYQGFLDAASTKRRSSAMNAIIPVQLVPSYVTLIEQR
jgi:uncharacterized protein YjbK